MKKRLKHSQPKLCGSLKSSEHQEEGEGDCSVAQLSVNSRALA